MAAENEIKNLKMLIKNLSKVRFTITSNNDKTFSLKLGKKAVILKVAKRDHAEFVVSGIE